MPKVSEEAIKKSDTWTKTELNKLLKFMKEFHPNTYKLDNFQPDPYGPSLSIIQQTDSQGW